MAAIGRRGRALTCPDAIPSVGVRRGLGTRARSSTDRASDYGSEGCRFESCRARPIFAGQRGSPVPIEIADLPRTAIRTAMRTIKVPRSSGGTRPSVTLRHASPPGLAGVQLGRQTRYRDRERCHQDVADRPTRRPCPKSRTGAPSSAEARHRDRAGRATVTSCQLDSSR